jgi:hypothetical protein
LYEWTIQPEVAQIDPATHGDLAIGSNGLLGSCNQACIAPAEVILATLRSDADANP